MERVDYESLIIADLLRFHTDGALELNPWYQRRSVWTEPQRAYLINTIFERKPVPSIYIRQVIDVEHEKSVKEIVDGQQRIRSIIAYYQNEFPARHPNRPDKVTYAALLKRERSHFLETKLSIGYLIGAEDSDVIEIFGRINSISKTLNPQEKRNARYSGDFKQYCLREAVQRLPFWREARIFTANDIARMQEVQYISDVIINLVVGLSDFSATKIDEYYRNYDDDFPQQKDVSQRLNNVFDCLVAVRPDVYHDTIFSVPQILFSLIIAMDRLSIFPKEASLTRFMRDIDRVVRGYQDLDVLTADQAKELSGFTGGNLHRILARRIRDKVICRELSKYGAASERSRLLLTTVK